MSRVEFTQVYGATRQRLCRTVRGGEAGGFRQSTSARRQASQIL